MINQLFNVIDWNADGLLLVAIRCQIYVFNPENSVVILQKQVCSGDYHVTQCQWLKLSREEQASSAEDAFYAVASLDPSQQVSIWKGNLSQGEQGVR